MTTDRLQGLLQRFAVSARMFHSGPLCGLHDFAAKDEGQLHLLRNGHLEVIHAGESRRISEPSLLFYPRPKWHRFITDATVGADLACANLSFGGGVTHPVAAALPAFICLPLHTLHPADPVLALLFDEAFSQRCGRLAVVDRLFEVVLVLLLRHLLDSGELTEGPLAGLGHPKLAKALTAIHDHPAESWSLTTLARAAGMSRSRFAEVFAQVVGRPPAAYLMRYRVTLAQAALRRGERLERIADAVGYGSAAALSRAFASVCGTSPRRWLGQGERVPEQDDTGPT